MKDSHRDLYYHRIGVDENSFMFISSPNFKNMKKYLKKKITTCEATAEELVEKFSSSENSPGVIEQKPVIPPLPVVPPPPLDGPTQAILATPKQEIIEQNEDEPSSFELINTPVQKIKTELKINAELQQSLEDRPTKEIPICKNFLRHNCTRRVCMFRHEFDISQLHGVYQFCKDYQNSVCRFPNCKYVHASVFEQERFYETGILPPHALSHQKRAQPVNKAAFPNGAEKSFLLLPPPPPPPPPPFSKSETQGMVHVSPKIKVNMNLTNPSPVHIGLQSRKVKLESLTKSAIEFNEKISTLDKKHKRLLICLFSYIKPGASQGNLNDVQGNLGHLLPTLKLPENTAYTGNTVSNINYVTGMFQQDGQDKVSQANIHNIQGNLGHLFPALKLPENAAYTGNTVSNGNYMTGMYQQDAQDKTSQINLNNVQGSLGHLFPALKLPENTAYAGNTVNNGNYMTGMYQQDAQDKMIEQLKNLINTALTNLNNEDASKSQQPTASSFPNINIGLKPQMNLHNTWTSHT